MKDLHKKAHPYFKGKVYLLIFLVFIHLYFVLLRLNLGRYPQLVENHLCQTKDF